MDKEDIEIAKLAMRLPWWVWAGLAALTFFVLHNLQIWSSGFSDKTLRELVGILALVFKYGFPAGMSMLAVVSLILRWARRQDLKSRQEL